MAETTHTLTEVRVDRWLCAARLYKSRGLAQQACAGGHVKLNGASVRASHMVRVGDWIDALAPRGRLKVEVIALEERRQPPARARDLYRDHSPAPLPDEPVVFRPRGAGRPTKADRRSMQRLRGEY